MAFTGFDRETFRFLLEITFNNNTEWFNANRKRYERCVRDPMRALAAELMPTALGIDPDFNPSVNASVSRIRRDTRFTYDKSPFRNHMWIAFRYPNKRISEGCTYYFEITPNGYSYGFGFYAASSAFMTAYRKKLLADPAGFLALAKEVESAGFFYDSDPFKRDRFPDVKEELKPYVNVKNYAWTKRFSGVKDVIAPSDIAERLKKDMLLAQPMYALMRTVFVSNEDQQ